MASLQAHSIPRGANVLHAAPRRQAAGLTTRPPAVRSLPPVRGALHAVASQGTASRVAQPFGGQVQLLPPFKLERYFAKHEFSAPYQLCNSDSEPLSMAELLGMADEDARDRWDHLRLAYTETQGLPALREAVAASSNYESVAAENVVVAAPSELISLAQMALLRPGDHVIVQHPGYQSLHEVAKSLGCEVSYWEPTLAPDGLSLSWNLGQLLAVLRDDTRLVVINFPHNPTGQMLSQQQFLQVVQACRKHGAWLLSDEMYRGLEFDAADRLPAAADAYPERGISLCGCSKSVGLPGLRIGWLASHSERFLHRVLELKDYSTICSSAPSEVLALIGLRSWDALLSRQLSICHANLGLMHQFMGRWGQVMRWQLPRAGTMAFPQLLLKERVDKFCDRLVSEAGVLLLPATVYGHEPSVRQGRFRVGFGREAMPQALEQLDGWLQRNQAPTA